jgi:hypothetical protein
VAALEGPDPKVANRAAFLLARRGDSRGLDWLDRAAASDDSLIRDRALAALGRVGGPEVIRRLVALVGANRSSPGSAGVGTLVDLGEAAARPMAEALAGMGHDGRYVMLQGLTKMGPRATAALCAALSSADSELKSLACQALGGTYGREDIPHKPTEPLVLLLSDRDAEVRRSAAHGLELLHWTPGDDRERALLQAATEPVSVRTSARPTRGKATSHAFHLEMSVQPGGARKEVHCLYGALTEVQRTLDLELWTDFALGFGLLYRYPETVILSGLSCEGKVGREAWTVNLRPFITVQGPGGVTFALDVDGRPVGGIDRGHREGWEVGGVNVDHQDFIEEARAWVDWSRVPMPDLPGAPIRRGESVWLAADDLNPDAVTSDDIDPEELGVTVLKYGWADTEAGATNDDFESEMAELLAVDPAWLAAADRSTVRIAESIRASRDFSCLGALADALEEAGCDNPLLLWHCRLPLAAHARGSWVVEFLLERAAGRKG